MTETLVQWFVTHLGGKAAKELIIFIISMIPILELRGGILAAGPAFLNIPTWRAIPICLVGNLIPIPFILLLIRPIFAWLRKTRLFRPLVEKLEKKGVYQLLSGTSKDSYMQIFNTVNNKELILPVYFQQKTKQHMFNHFFCPPYDTEKAGLQPGTLGAAATPTDEYASAFDIKVGQEWESFDWTHLNEYSEGPWGNRDPRFYASILYNGANWTGRQLELYVGGKDGYMDFSTSASQDYVRTSTTGYIFRKFMDESDNINYVDIESTSYWIEMRYAEIVLILSEAYARLDKFKEAYDYLNKIRTRVGLPILAQQSTWDNYLEDLSKERVCELGLEGHRWYDLVRWDIAQKILNGQRLHGIKIEKTGSSFLYTRVECDTQDRKFPKKYNIFPIPSSELRNNIMCEQTPSWK